MLGVRSICTCWGELQSQPALRHIWTKIQSPNEGGGRGIVSGSEVEAGIASAMQASALLNVLHKQRHIVRWELLYILTSVN